MPAVYCHRHTVTPPEIDALGHVNNLEYLRWMLEAALEHSALQGWPTEAYQGIGAGWVVRAHTIEYLRSALVDDEIVVRTWVANMKRATSLRRYRIVRAVDDKVLAVASTDWAFVNYQTGLPTRIPPEVIQSFEIVPEEAGP